MMIRDADFRIVDINPAWEAMSGYSRADVVGLDRAIFSDPVQSAARRALHARALAGERVQFEVRGTTKDGRPFIREVRLMPLRIGGQPHVLQVGQDVTDRRTAEERLRASEEDYRAIFNASDNSMMIRDADFRIVDVNPSWEAMSGFPRAEAVGRHWTEFSDPGEREERRALHARALAGEHIQLEVRGTSKDGRKVVREVRLMPILFRGAPHVLQMGSDITRRKADEERLRASEEQYRAIFNASVDPMVLRDADFRIVDVNAAYEAQSGFGRSEVLGLQRLTVSDASQHEMRRALHDRALAGERVQTDIQGKTKDGHAYLVEVRLMPMQFRGQQHVLAIGHDVTERRKAEERLRASEEHYRAIFNATDQMMVLRDAEFRIVDVNPAYEAVTGYARAELIGADRVVTSEAGEFDRRRSLHARALAGEQFQFEVQDTSKDGKPFQAEVRLMPIRFRGRPHVLQVGQDITGRNKAEWERAQLEAQLRQAQKMEAIGHLTGGIAHDFNNILQGIMGNLTLASERRAGKDDGQVDRYIERAQHSAQRARELIGQMLTFSRGQRGRRTPVALADLVRDACKLLRSTLPSTIDLRLNLDEVLPPLELDPVQVEQVVLNLCINARDAMRGTGAIGIGLRPAVRFDAGSSPICASCRQKVAGSFIELSVRDTGPGIPPQVLDRIFEPFFSTKAAGQGSGMGLSLAHGIVHDHGGHILVDTMLNERTKFRVLLPVPAGAAAEATPAGDPTLPPLRARPRLAGRVLVVDDEQAIREFMADLLGGWGLEVVALPDGAAARDAFAADPGRYDLVITDQTMPQLTGIALAKELSRLRPGLPVILYTGYAEDLSPQELREAGILSLVRKPIEPAQFFPLLAAHLPAR